MDLLVDIHSWYRWVVLAVLVVMGSYGLQQAVRNAEWGVDQAKKFVLATVLFDLQIALGIILWISAGGWNRDSFIKVIHPLGMLVAVTVAHIMVGKAKRSPNGFRLAGIGLLAALVIVGGVIPRYAWF